MAQIGRKLRSLEGGFVAFMCPGCERMHQIRVKGQGRPRWEWNGDADAPTFSPSVFVNRPGSWHTATAPTCHSFVEAGRIRFLSDCTHELAGQTVELPDITPGA